MSQLPNQTYSETTIKQLSLIYRKQIMNKKELFYKLCLC